METRRLTMAQAVIKFLANQYVERDGRQHQFFAGCFGIFGHGIVAGIGEALLENPELRYYMPRNEQAQVHTATAFAKASNRLRAMVCTSSIGPGATNMVTGAATATVNRLPVLLLPGDIFARRNVAPVLQQLESFQSQDISVNDCFKPVSRYWDRINRPDQIITSLPEAMRVLTSPADTGAVTLALPQDVQAEAYDYPAELFERRVWVIGRARPDANLVRVAGEWIRGARHPLIVAGGGVLYSGATAELLAFAERHGIPVAETQAGKGAMPYDNAMSLGAMGVTGTPGANIAARQADVVIGIGTRYSDFTTASKTAFQNPDVRFVNINVAEFDAYKHMALPLVGDALATLGELDAALAGYQTSVEYRGWCARQNQEWDAEVSRIYSLGWGPPISQGEVVGAVNEAAGENGVVVCAAGSLPGDLHKLWRTKRAGDYHLEYGYSCMGYEIAGGLGVKMADPSREVYVMVGDGSYLMMSTEIVTSIQENQKLIIVMLDNHGFASIGGLSKAVGNGSFGIRYAHREDRSGKLDGENIAVDFAGNARSLGAHVISARDLTSVKAALCEAKAQSGTTVIVVETDREQRVAGYESWWDVPVSEVSGIDDVRQRRVEYELAVKKERSFL